MIKKESLAKCIVLSIVTCGIYAFIWFYNMTKEVVSAGNRAYKTSPGTATLLYLVTCGIYGIYWSYKMGEALDDISISKGLQPSNRAVLYLLLSLFGLSLVSWILIQLELNKLADA